MNDKQKAQKIKADLETRFNRARFKVAVRAGDDVTVDFLGGHNYADEFPTYEACNNEMAKIIRKTIPNFQWLDYTTREGEVVYRP
jgi:hypothetical protein